MQVPPTLELIRQNRSMYLRGEEPSRRLLAVRLADCALVSGAERLELLMLADGWMAVASDADWITRNLQEHRNPSMDRAFTAMIPLRGGRQNEVRFEVIVTAFSRSLTVKSGDRWIAIVGDAPPSPIRDRVGRNEFAVVFRTESGA